MNRTATFDEPTPPDVYPDIPRYVQAPDPIYLGEAEFKMIGMPPRKQTWVGYLICIDASRIAGNGGEVELSELDEAVAATSHSEFDDMERPWPVDS